MFRKDRLVVDTMGCHRLMEWAYQAAPAKADDLMEAMFRALFLGARNVGEPAELHAIIAEAGLTAALAAEAADVIDSPELFRADVIAFDASVKGSNRPPNFDGIPFWTLRSSPELRSGAQPEAPVRFSGAQVGADAVSPS